MSNSLVTPWTAARQAPLSMKFSRQEYWSELPFPPPGDLPDPGIQPESPALAGGFFTTEPPGKPINELWILSDLIIQRLFLVHTSQHKLAGALFYSAIQGAELMETQHFVWTMGSSWWLQKGSKTGELGFGFLLPQPQNDTSHSYTHLIGQNQSDDPTQLQ